MFSNDSDSSIEDPEIKKNFEEYEHKRGKFINLLISDPNIIEKGENIPMMKERFLRIINEKIPQLESDFINKSGYTPEDVFMKRFSLLMEAKNLHGRLLNYWTPFNKLANLRKDMEKLAEKLPPKFNNLSNYPEVTPFTSSVPELPEFQDMGKLEEEAKKAHKNRQVKKKQKEEIKKKALELAESLKVKYNRFINDNKILEKKLKKTEELLDYFNEIMKKMPKAEEKFKANPKDRKWKAIENDQKKALEIYDYFQFLRQMTKALSRLRQEILEDLNQIPDEFQSQEISNIQHIPRVAYQVPELELPKLKSKSEVLGKSLVLLAISENQEYSEEALEFANNINKKYSMYMRDNDELAMSLEKVQGIANRYEAILEDYLYTEEKYRIYQTDKWWQSLVKKQTEIKEIYENLILFRSKIANLESLKEKILKKLNNLPPEFQGQEIPKIRPVVFTIDLIELPKFRTQEEAVEFSFDNSKNLFFLPRLHSSLKYRNYYPLNKKNAVNVFDFGKNDPYLGQEDITKLLGPSLDGFKTYIKQKNIDSPEEEFECENFENNDENEESPEQEDPFQSDSSLDDSEQSVNFQKSSKKNYEPSFNISDLKSDKTLYFDSIEPVPIANPRKKGYEPSFNLSDLKCDVTQYFESPVKVINFPINQSSDKDKRSCNTSNSKCNKTQCLNKTASHSAKNQSNDKDEFSFNESNSIGNKAQYFNCSIGNEYQNGAQEDDDGDMEPSQFIHSLLIPDNLSETARNEFETAKQNVQKYNHLRKKYINLLKLHKISELSKYKEDFIQEKQTFLRIINEDIPQIEKSFIKKSGYERLMEWEKHIFLQKEAKEAYDSFLLLWDFFKDLNILKKELDKIAETIPPENIDDQLLELSDIPENSSIPEFPKFTTLYELEERAENASSKSQQRRKRPLKKSKPMNVEDMKNSLNIKYNFYMKSNRWLAEKQEKIEEKFYAFHDIIESIPEAEERFRRLPLDIWWDEIVSMQDEALEIFDLFYALPIYMDRLNELRKEIIEMIKKLPKEMKERINITIEPVNEFEVPELYLPKIYTREEAEYSFDSSQNLFFHPTVQSSFSKPVDYEHLSRRKKTKFGTPEHLKGKNYWMFYKSERPKVAPQEQIQQEVDPLQDVEEDTSDQDDVNLSDYQSSYLDPMGSQLAYMDQHSEGNSKMSYEIDKNAFEKLRKNLLPDSNPNSTFNIEDVDEIDYTLFRNLFSGLLDNSSRLSKSIMILEENNYANYKKKSKFNIDFNATLFPYVNVSDDDIQDEQNLDEASNSHSRSNPNATFIIEKSKDSTNEALSSHSQSKPHVTFSFEDSQHNPNATFNIENSQEDQVEQNDDHEVSNSQRENEISFQIAQNMSLNSSNLFEYLQPNEFSIQNKTEMIKYFEDKAEQILENETFNIDSLFISSDSQSDDSLLVFEDSKVDFGQFPEDIIEWYEMESIVRDPKLPRRTYFTNFMDLHAKLSSISQTPENRAIEIMMYYDILNEDFEDTQKNIEDFENLKYESAQFMCSEKPSYEVKENYCLLYQIAEEKIREFNVRIEMIKQCMRICLIDIRKNQIPNVENVENEFKLKVEV